MFDPVFSISPRLMNILMDIEASRQAVASLPVSAHLLKSLRESARLTSTHYSTQIEGNRLTQQQVKEVSQGGTFPNRKRDEREVKHYFTALDYVADLIRDSAGRLSVEMVQSIHACVMDGKQKPSPYRDGQNVIRESGSGSIIYMPPEAKDVAGLMADLVLWVNEEKSKGDLPIPMIAGVAHYQFATIHPYYDGNGRTARLLTNLILHQAGYGLNGIYSLEEYYAKNLSAYYDAISVGDSHNYYMGRAEADIGEWIEYFCEGVADAFSKVRGQAESLRHLPDQRMLLRELDERQKRVLPLFEQSRFVTTNEIATLLQVQPRTALNICKKWVDAGFLLQQGERKARRYELTEKWVALVVGEG